MRAPPRLGTFVFLAALAVQGGGSTALPTDRAPTSPSPNGDATLSVPTSSPQAPTPAPTTLGNVVVITPTPTTTTTPPSPTPVPIPNIGSVGVVRPSEEGGAPAASDTVASLEALDVADMPEAIIASVVNGLTPLVARPSLHAVSPNLRPVTPATPVPTTTRPLFTAPRPEATTTPPTTTKPPTNIPPARTMPPTTTKPPTTNPPTTASPPATTRPSPSSPLPQDAALITSVPATAQPTASPPSSQSPSFTGAPSTLAPPMATGAAQSTPHDVVGTADSTTVRNDASNPLASPPSPPTTSPRTQPPTTKPTDPPVQWVRERFNMSHTQSPLSGSSDHDASLPVIIGGLDERHSVDGSSQGSTSTLRNAPVAGTYHTLQYVVSICAAISMVLVIGFHGVAVDEQFDWYDVVCSPTTWEFVVYVSYVQHLASISELVLVKTPPSLWKVFDGLSWTCLLPYHSSESAIGVVTSKTAAPASRRLETILLSGMVAFADRIGFKESDLLVRTATGLAVFGCVFLVFFFVFAAVAKRRMDAQDDHPSRRGDTEELARVAFWRNISMRVCCLLVLLWFFALYPLSSVSTYEVTMELRAHSLSAGQLFLAVIAILVLCLGGLLLVGYTVSSRSRAELSQPFHLAAWGSLYADYAYAKRSFLVVPVLVQIVTGVVVGAVSSGKIQLGLLLAIFVVYLLAMWVVRPFVPGSAAPWFVVGITVLKIINLSLALASFTVENEWSSDKRASAADAVVYLNLLVIVCWFLRHVVMLAQAIRYMRRVATRDHRAPSWNLPPPHDTPQHDQHAGGFLALDSQRSLYESQRSESSRGMTSSLYAWKKQHLAIA